MIQVTLKSVNAISGAPYTVTVSDDATNNRLPENSPWIPDGYYHGKFEGITATGGTPYISASSFKAKLREHAVRIVTSYDELQGEGRMKYINLFTLLKGGQMAGKEDIKSLDISTVMNNIREASPIMGLFGGAFPSFQKSSVLIGNFYAIHEEGKVIERVPTVRRTLGEIAVRHARDHYDSAMERETKKDIRTEAKAEKDKLNKELKAAEDAATKKQIRDQIAALDKETKNKNVVDDQQLHAMWCLPRGVVFEQTITTHDINEREAGLLFLAMKEFQKNPKLGGRGSMGFGADFQSIDWVISIDGEDCGTVTNPVGKAQDMIDAFYGGEYNSDIESFLTDAKTSKDDKSIKKAKSDKD